MILDLTLLRRSLLLQQLLLIAGATIGDGMREGWFGSLCCIISPVSEQEGAPGLCSPLQSILFTEVKLNRNQKRKKERKGEWTNPKA